MKIAVKNTCRLLLPDGAKVVVTVPETHDGKRLEKSINQLVAAGAIEVEPEAAEKEADQVAEKPEAAAKPKKGASK